MGGLVRLLMIGLRVPAVPAQAVVAASRAARNAAKPALSTPADSHPCSA